MSDHSQDLAGVEKRLFKTSVNFRAFRHLGARHRAQIKQSIFRITKKARFPRFVAKFVGVQRRPSMGSIGVHSECDISISKTCLRSYAYVTLKNFRDIIITINDFIWQNTVILSK